MKVLKLICVKLYAQLLFYAIKEYRNPLNQEQYQTGCIFSSIVNDLGLSELHRVLPLASELLECSAHEICSTQTNAYIGLKLQGD